MFRKAGIGFLALALLAPGLASALGVGDYQLSSYLNQPLKMTVNLTDTGDLSAEEILVTLASQRDFDNAGVDRVFFLSDLEFSVEVSGDGSGVLTITSAQPVREPFLDFLVEVLWPQGRILREYTVLLDPPSYADEMGTVPAESVAAQPVTTQQAPAAAQPVPAQTSPQPVETVTAPAAAVQAPAAQPSSTVGTRDEYVVQSQDTMWRIALNTRPSRSVSVQQMILTIQEMNPDAFIDGNVNLVREGTVLRLPTEAEIRGISARDALTEMADQNRRWREKLAARGIVLPSRTQVGGRAGDDRSGAADDQGEGSVTLVSPEAGSAGEGGSGAGGQGSAALENEIAIREESIDQLRRDNDELSSRLQDLQGQVETSDQLLQLRNDQIARLQDELRKLQEAQGLEPSDPLADDPALSEGAVARTDGADGAEGGAKGTPAGAGASDGTSTSVAGGEGAGQDVTTSAGAATGGASSGGLGGPSAGVATTDGGAVGATGGVADAGTGGGVPAGRAPDPMQVDLGAVQNYGGISAQPTGDPDLDVLLQSDTGPMGEDLAAVMESTGSGGGMQIQLQGAPGGAPAVAIGGADAGGESADGSDASAEGADQGGIVQMVQDNLLALIALLVALALVIVGLIVVRNRQKAKADQEQPLAAMDGADDDFFVDNIDDEEVEGTFEGEEAAEDDGPAPSQDPLEQVDVYVAYGRHAEALGLLRHEIEQAPARSDLKVRLLEVLAEMNDREGFEQEAGRFADDADAQARAQELRAGMEGGVAADDGPSLDDLEMDLTADDGGDDLDATLVLDATGEQDSAEMDDFGLDLGGDEPEADADEGGLDLDLDLSADDDADEGGLDLDLGGEEPAAEEDGLDLDLGGEAEGELDLDLGGGDEPAADEGGLDFELDSGDAGDAELDLDLGSEPAAAEDDLSLDMDLSTDDASSDAGDLEFSLDDEPAADDAAEEFDLALDDGDAGADLGLDLAGSDAGDDAEMDLDLDDVSMDDASDEFQDAAEAPAEEELDLSLDDLGVGEAEEPTEASLPAVDEEDLSGATEQRDAFSLDGVDDDAGAATDMRSAVDLSAGADEDDFDFLGDTDENATKLDLAKAYIDMGDSEGARDILNEVISEGNDAQQQEARDLLTQVG